MAPQDSSIDTKPLKLYVLHDSNEWMEPWRKSLDSHFGPDGYEEWLLDGTGHIFDLNFDFGQPPPQGVFFCKGSGSSHMRGLPHARDCTTAVLQWLEYHGRLVVNGERAFAAETSKVTQLVAISNFGLKSAKTTAVFGTRNLMQGAEAFLATLNKGTGFLIQFNRAGGCRGLRRCYSLADVDAFLKTGIRSPDEIYILQEGVDISTSVRMEFSFGKLLYGLESRNVDSLESRNGCESTTMSSILSDGPTTLSCQSVLALSAFTGLVGSVAGTFLPKLVKVLQDRFGEQLRDLSLSKILTIVAPMTGLGLLALAGQKSAINGKISKKSGAAAKSPARLLRADALQKEYPLLAMVTEKVKPLMSHFGAETLALDVAMVEGQVTVLDINIHSNYGADVEKEHNLAFETTGVGSACLGLSSLLKDMAKPTELDLSHIPSESLVFGIGLPRTGTHSLAESLKLLGYRGRHNTMLGKRHLEYTPKTRQLAGYFHVDSSHCRRYEELFRSHPNARFVLSTRLDEDWKESMVSQGAGEVLKDLPTPNEFLSEVLRFFVNHHATHRLMVCNIFSETDELLWNKLIGFLPAAQKFQVAEQPFPRIVPESDGRLCKAGKVKKSASQPLLPDFRAYTATNEGSRTPRSSAGDSEITSQRSSATHGKSDSESQSQVSRVLSRYLDSKNTYEAKFIIRPDNAEVAKVAVLDNARLTPKVYDRHIFNLVLKVEGTPLAEYDAGDCIGIYAESPKDKVNEFLTGMDFDPTELLELDSYFTGTEEGTYVMSLQQVCTEYLDLCGAPSRGFYLELSKFSKDYVERDYLAELSLPRKSADFEAREALSVTYASTILEFKSLKITPMNLLDLIPLTKPRLYSIASSRHKHPGEVHLCIVTHTWDNSSKEEVTGLSTGYLEKLNSNVFPLFFNLGATAVASLVRSPVLKLPKDPAAPVIMAGMGTGMAPFRAFIEDRSCMRQKGQAIGPMRLYFGARHKHGEFLYQNELESYADQGWLKLRCAWSRDQKQKIYVQMLIAEDEKTVWDMLKPEAGGSFYMCGPIQPLPDIKKALVNIFVKNGLTASYLDEMEAAGRFATEVY
jgi:sulfite reductase alpha subunit-like flavoprotein